MLGRARGTRRVAAVVGAVLALVAVGCSDDDGGEEAVAIGPGSDTGAPAEELADADPGTEPSWTGDVPAVAEPEATPAEQAAAAEAGGGSYLTAPGEAARFDGPERDYAGTMQIELAYYDYCQTLDGNLGYAGSATYQMPAEVYLNPPAAHGGLQERSPFNLIAASQLGNEGSLLLVSAQVVTDPTDGRSALIDYWDIDQSGDQVDGVLTDRWPGLVLNTIDTTQLLVPCRPELGSFPMSDSIAEGAQLSGSIGDGGVHLEVLAQSYDREVRFRAVIDAEPA